MSHYKKIAVVILIAILCFFLALLYYTGAFGPHLVLRKATFDELTGWQQDNANQALRAFQKSCVKIMERDTHSDYGRLPQAGKVKEWQAICLIASKLTSIDDANARVFFETYFQPYQVNNNFNSQGLFTGYYLPLLRGSLKKQGDYTIPIYGLPSDLVKVNLGGFIADLAGKTVTGQIKNHQLNPYPDRKAITQGAIHLTAPVLVWGDNEVDIFFAQIQGSALVELPNGQQLLLGYAGANGHAYTSIGSVLIRKKILNKETISMQSIKAWLTEHPQDRHTILNENASYVFFDILKTRDAIGTQQVPLTPQRSLAVDRRYIPLGVPVWLETTVPDANTQSRKSDFNHLLIAQDTGGNIKGVIRGDVYWGPGEEAAYIAGHMNSKGKYWVLLPRHSNAS